MWLYVLVWQSWLTMYVIICFAIFMQKMSCHASFTFMCSIGGRCHAPAFRKRLLGRSAWRAQPITSRMIRCCMDLKLLYKRESPRAAVTMPNPTLGHIWICVKEGFAPRKKSSGTHLQAGHACFCDLSVDGFWVNEFTSGLLIWSTCF